MPKTCDEALLAALDALALEEHAVPLTGDEFDRVLARALAGTGVPLPTRQEAKPMKKKTLFTAALAAAAACLCLGAAAGWLLTPRETAQALGYDALANAFDAPDAVAVNETQTDAGYDVTLLGLTTGENLTGYWNSSRGALTPGRTYAALAIRASDGTPIPALNDPGNTLIDGGLCVGPFIEGEAPIDCNPMMMHPSWSATVVDGTFYIVVECDSILPFADRTVYLMVQQGMFPDFGAYTFDAATGAIGTDPAAAEGINVLFTLPLDPARADPAQAEALLDEWRAAPDTGAALPTSPSERADSAPSGG